MGAVSKGSSASSEVAQAQSPSISGRWHKGSGDSEAWTTGVHGTTRDRFFFGMHAAKLYGTEAEDLDLYGTLREKRVRLTPATIHRMYADARERTMRLVEDLSDEDLLAGPDPSLNPLLWVLGHVGHFYEAMILRPLCPGLELHTPGTLLHGYDVDGMFDSFRADHGDRWALEALQEAHGWEAIPPAHPAPGC